MGASSRVAYLQTYFLGGGLFGGGGVFEDVQYNDFMLQVATIFNLKPFSYGFM